MDPFEAPPQGEHASPQWGHPAPTSGQAADLQAQWTVISEDANFHLQAVLFHIQSLGAPILIGPSEIRPLDAHWRQTSAQWEVRSTFLSNVKILVQGYRQSGRRILESNTRKIAAAKASLIRFEEQRAKDLAQPAPQRQTLSPWIRITFEAKGHLFYALYPMIAVCGIRRPDLDQIWKQDQISEPAGKVHLISLEDIKRRFQRVCEVCEPDESLKMVIAAAKASLASFEHQLAQDRAEARQRQPGQPEPFQLPPAVNFQLEKLLTELQRLFLLSSREVGSILKSVHEGKEDEFVDATRRLENSRGQIPSSKFQGLKQLAGAVLGYVRHQRSGNPATLDELFTQAQKLRHQLPNTVLALESCRTRAQPRERNGAATSSARLESAAPRPDNPSPVPPRASPQSQKRHEAAEKKERSEGGADRPKIPATTAAAPRQAATSRPPSPENGSRRSVEIQSKIRDSEERERSNQEQMRRGDTALALSVPGPPSPGGRKGGSSSPSRRLRQCVIS